MKLSPSKIETKINTPVFISPKRGYSRMTPIQLRDWEMDTPCPCTPSLQNPSRPTSLSPFHLIQDPVQNHVSYSTVCLWTLFNLGEFLSLPSSFVSFKSTALSFWKNPSNCVYPKFSHDQPLAGHFVQGVTSMSTA